MKETLEIVGWIGVAAFTLTQLKIYDVAADLRARKWIPEQAEIKHDTPPMSPAASPSISPTPIASPSPFSLTASPSPSASPDITIKPN